MQLEATLFGVCVLQIRPQLERILQLDTDSLLKEVTLTDHILTLFVDYHVRAPHPLIDRENQFPRSRPICFRMRDRQTHPQRRKFEW